MIRVFSTYFFYEQPLAPELLRQIAAAGINHVEIFAGRYHFNYVDRGAVREMADWLTDRQIHLDSIHSPVYLDSDSRRRSEHPISIAEPERVRRLEAVEEVKRVLEVAEAIPYRYLVQHLGLSHDAFDQRKFDAAFNSLEHLCVFAKQRGVTIALENIPNELSTAPNLLAFIDQTRLRDLRICFDAGHAHLAEGVEPVFSLLKDLVVTTHLHDNHGDRDAHLFPYEGSIDWDVALKAFSQKASLLPFVLELKDHGVAEPLRQVQEVFERFEAALAPPSAGPAPESQ
jgi:sugar phosphate isomerase/epimerase